MGEIKGDESEGRINSKMRQFEQDEAFCFSYRRLTLIMFKLKSDEIGTSEGFA